MKFAPDIRKTRTDSPLGAIILAATGQGLAGVWFDDQKHRPHWQGWPDRDEDPTLLQVIAELHQYFEGERTRFDVPLDLRVGTPFQQSVWQALLGIPFGVCTSYSTLAATLRKPLAVRAVGTAVGRNPVGIIVPCHRVLGADGSLTGYAGGLGRKAALLTLESGAPRAGQPAPTAWHPNS
jgi:methylated-DNA-[protein]-cysteine S-methyltransferase